MSGCRGQGMVVTGGSGLSGVTVSDGLNVTTTGADGEFVLPGEGPFIFVCRPTGYASDRWYLPVGRDLRFELRTQEQPVPFTFAQVTDLHVSLGDSTFGAGQGDATLWFDDQGLHERIVTTPAVFSDLLDEMAARSPELAFVVATGDLTNTGSAGEFKAYARAADRACLHVVSLPGNHDHPSIAEAVFPYERHLGPRWFSMDYAGVHFVAIDWFSWRLGVDRREQDEWLQADLGLLPADAPVVMFTHDQMTSEFYRGLAVRPLASFSGHWHTSRVAEDRGTVHYNSGPATFGGLDFSPAHYRLATWDGEALTVRTVVRGPEELADATVRPGDPAKLAGCRWQVPMAGACQQAGPVVVGATVVATSKLEDQPGGAVESFDLVSGTRRWMVALQAAVKATPLVVDGFVVAASVTGETVCIDAETGEERWRVHLADPLQLWVYLSPVTDGTCVFIGDVGRFCALDLATGNQLWCRDDLGVQENLTSFAHPAVVDGRLLVGFAGQLPDLWALDPATGATVWPIGQVGRSVYSGTQAELVTTLPRSLMAGITCDPEGVDVYVVRLGSRLERLRAVDGSVVWSVPFWGWFNPAAPVVCGDSVLAIAGTGEVWCYRRRDGRLLWTSDVGRPSPLAFGAYRRDGAATLAAPTVAGGTLLVASGDGRIVALRSLDGRIVAEFAVGVPLVGPLAVVEEMVLCVAADGVVRAVDLRCFASTGA